MKQSDMHGLWNKFNDLLGSTLLHPQYFVKRIESICVQQITSGKYDTLIDIGCGRQWYRPQIEPKVKKYYALDHPIVSKKYSSLYPIDFKTDATNIPLKDKTLDGAFMIMVLEHLPDPDKALQEVHRVLRRDGVFFVCTVENYPGHDMPYNYYHWTKYGLKTIFKRNGFKIKKIQSFGNPWECQVIYQNVFLMQTVKHSAQRNIIFGFILLILLAPIMIISNIFAIILGGQKNNLEFSLGHIVTAQA